jgi:hypothetical protein
MNYEVDQNVPSATSMAWRGTFLRMHLPSFLLPYIIVSG